MASYRLCKPPFQDYKATGPYFNSHSGRHMLTLVPLEPEATGLKVHGYPYARYLMGVLSGALLAKDQETDHIDGDRTHDLLPNLRVVSKSENASKASSDPLTLLRRSEKLYEFKCPHCGKLFQRMKGKSHLGKKGGSNVTYCSVECSRFWAQHKGHKQEIRWVEPEKYEPKLRHEPWEDWSLQLPSKYAFKLKVSKAATKTCDMCRKPFTGKRKKARHSWFCSEACAKRAKAREVPSRDRMEKLVTDVASGKDSWTAIGRRYGKSDNAVRKWAKKYGLL